MSRLGVLHDRLGAVLTACAKNPSHVANVDVTPEDRPPALLFRW
jgi:hypothetical protein